MNAMRSFLISGLLLAALLHATAANYTIQLNNITWSGGGGGYNCFSATAYPNTINFTITKGANTRRAYAFTAGPSQTTGNYTRQLRSGANRLNYALYTTSAMTYHLKAPTTATANEVISGRAANYGQSQVIPLSFIFHVAPGQVVPPGTYTDSITFGVYPAYNNNNPDTTRTVTLTVVVTAGAATSIVPTGGAFNSASPQLALDFGALTPGQIRSCDMLVKQNNNCTLTYSSANGGVMKLIPTPTTDQIPYTLSLGGNTLNLSTPGSRSLPSGVSPQPDGNRYPINITIGSFDGVAAGTYQDQITFTVVAN
jgi:spore coat protein U-like protein